MAERTDVERLAVLETKMESVEKSLDNLAREVAKLTAVMNKGKGAYAVSMLIASLFGAFILKLSGVLFKAVGD